jgi:hypothetical protein
MDFYKSIPENFEKLNLTIADLIDGTDSTRYRFKAYLDESEVSYQIMEQNLAYTPLSFVNDKVHTRTTQKVKLKFNVFSEDFNEAQENYNQLHKLIESIKPKFSFVREQYLPDIKNNKGLISVKFKGLPKVSSEYGDDLVIHLSQFSYDINKELGYIERPMSGSGYIGGDNRLIPIAYVLNISGQILLPFKETIRLGEEKKATNITLEALNYAQTAGGIPFSDALSNGQTDYLVKLLDGYANLASQVNLRFLNLDDIPDEALQGIAWQDMHEIVNLPGYNGKGIVEIPPGYINFQILSEAEFAALNPVAATNYAFNKGQYQMYKASKERFEEIAGGMKAYLGNL